jgi:hypothetical protein
LRRPEATTAIRDALAVVATTIHAACEYTVIGIYAARQHRHAEHEEERQPPSGAASTPAKEKRMREGRTSATRSLTVGETEEGWASQILVTLARSRRWAPGFLRRRRKKRWAPVFAGEEEGGAGGENERRSGVAKKMCMRRERRGLRREDACLSVWTVVFYILGGPYLMGWTL